MNGHPDRDKKLAAIAAAHDDWVEAHADNAEFDPVRAAKKPGSDYNLHYLDVNPPPGAEEDFHRRVGMSAHGQASQFARTWGELGAVVELASSGGRHTPGTDYEWKHDYIPLTHAAATSHFKGKVPKEWTAPGGGKEGKAGSPHAAAAYGIAANVRFERGLSRFQREEAEQRLGSAAQHLNAGDHEKAASELDEAMRASSLRGGGIIKGSTAAQARDLRDKIRAEHPAPGPHPADKMTVASDKHAAARSLSNDDLKRANQELSRRAVLLGKPGQQSKGQQAVQAEMQRRSIAMSMTWDDLARVIELVGPKGYIHGWIYVGVPGAGQEVNHPRHGHGTVTGAEHGRVSVAFDNGHSADFPVRTEKGPARFEQMTDDELSAEYQRDDASQHSRNAVTAELERRDNADHDAKAERVSALYAEKPKTEADRNRVYQGLVNEGEDPEEAWAHAHGAGDEDMRKQAAIADLRGQGYKGAGFDALARAAHKDDVRRRTVMAENATNGYMLSPKEKQAGIDPYSLFTGPESRARKYASPELKEWFDQNGRPTAADFQAQLIGRKTGMKPADFYASVTWDDLSAVIDLSARTAALEVTPAPYGKPGGPGLYDVKGLMHTPYFEQIVKALMEKRGMDKGHAAAIAYGALRKWARGGGNVHPEVRAAAVGALAGEKAAGATARAVHGHSNAYGWDDISRVIEMAATGRSIDLVGPHGYIHGWIYVGGPGLPSVADHNAKLRAKGITPPTKAHPALTKEPPAMKAGASAKPAPATTSVAKASSAPKMTATKPASETPPVKAPSTGDPAAGKLVEEMTALASLGGKATQKAVLKKKSDTDLQGLDAEYTRRGSTSGKIMSAHQLVKDEIASRGGKPLPAPSPDEMKAAHAATVSARAKEAVGPHTKEELVASWSHGYRYSGTSESKDKRDKDFAVEMHRLLSTNKQPNKCGPGCQDAHKFLDMVGHDSVPQDKEMQRGLTLTPAAAERMFKPGKTMDMPVSSWTSDPKMAASYTKGEKKSDAGKTKVILHAAPGAKGMDITDMSAWGNEHEVVTGGRFNVDKVQNEGGVMHVYMSQKDFSAH